MLVEVKFRDETILMGNIVLNAAQHLDMFLSAQVRLDWCEKQLCSLLICWHSTHTGGDQRWLE